MAYRIDNPDDATGALRRVANRQAKAAIRAIREVDHGNAVATVLDCRKRCKKIRGIARLLRPVLGDEYRRTNDLFGEAARVLSGYRDTAALVETLDRAVGADDAVPPAIGQIRRSLVAKAETEATALTAGSEPLVLTEDLLVAGRMVIKQWEPASNGWDALSPGLIKTHSKGARSLARANAKPTPTRLHDLRTPAKYTWYHLRLIQLSAPTLLVPLAANFHDLVDYLGDAHDLALLSELVRVDPAAAGGAEAVEEACEFFDRFRLPLEQLSLGLASRLYGEDSTAFADRLGQYWKIWRADGAGPIGDARIDRLRGLIPPTS